MQEKYYSLREFAKKVGVSPQRLSELVKRGYIKTSASGMIPESEVEYFIREKLLKDLSHNPNSYLCIVFDKTSEELSEFKEYYDEKMKEGFSDIIEVSSITGLVKRLRIAVITNGASNDTTVLLYTRYQKELLKELVKRVQAAAFRCLCACVAKEEAGKVPIICAYELFMYGKIYSYDEETAEIYHKILSEEGTKGSSWNKSDPISTMEESFKSIAISLNIPLEARGQLTPEVVKVIEAMSVNDYGKPDGEFFDWFFGLNLLPKDESKTRKTGAEAAKVFNSVRTKLSQAHRSTEIHRTSYNGFYTIVNITKDFPSEGLTSLYNDMEDGYYKNVEIFGSSVNDIAMHLQDPLLSSIGRHQRNRSAVVTFLSESEIFGTSSEEVSS